jgi:metal-responsive CopG/Arc/MetJ family transcriptional regulator
MHHMGCVNRKDEFDAKITLCYIIHMTQDTQIAVRISERLLDVLDDLRRNEKDLPSRAEMIRRLIERGAEVATD